MSTNPLPPDPEKMNDRRAQSAGEALKAFMLNTGTDEEDALADLLTNLRHWADRSAYDFENEQARADRNYAEETTDEH